MKNVIVTGATSYIAISLIDRLISSGYKVYAVVRPYSRNLGKISPSINIEVIELDLIDIGKLEELDLPMIDAIYHFAWEGVRGARDNNILQEQNCESTKRCIDVCIKLQIPYFIGIGSQAEYGITNQIITEQTALRPISAYGRSKVESYNYGMEMYERGKLKFIWARIFSVYGKGENPNTLLMQCITKMRTDESIDLSPCEHMWDYTYVDDVTEALFLLLEKKVEGGAYNISYGQARKLKEYVLQIKSIIFSESNLNFGAIPYKDGQIVQMNPDVFKLKSRTGWMPKTDFEAGIKNIIKG